MFAPLLHGGKFTPNGHCTCSGKECGNCTFLYYSRQEREHKVFVQRKMIGHKYFKPTKNPILLTWAEKEQMRYLHNSDPEKWNVEKLAQSFPASEEIVKVTELFINLLYIY